MEDQHLTLELLRAIHRGTRNPGDLVPVAMAHLFELCPHCRHVFESWRRELGEGVAGPSLAQYDSAFERLRGFLRGEQRGSTSPGVSPDRDLSSPQERVRAEEGEARKLAAELLGLSPRDRAQRLRRNPQRFTGPALADLLLEEARGCLPGRPREAYSVAGLARAVLQHGEPTQFSIEVYARALAHQANALRAQGELRRADELLEVARYFVKAQGGGDRATQAELDSFEGSLRRAQRRFDEAEELFSRAVMACALEDQTVAAARNLIALGMVYREKADFERAIETTAQACELISEQQNPSLKLVAEHNLAYFFHEAGRTTEARELLAMNAPLYERHGDPLTSLRRLWLEADLAKADGDVGGAEAGYRAVRDGFLARGIGYDAALAALDLALVYAEKGRTAELKKLVEEIVPVFEAQDVHREAATALMLFQDAVRTEHVTLGYLMELSRYLERARLDPSLPFQTPV